MIRYFLYGFLCLWQLLAYNAASAQATYDWTGAVNSTWTTAGNWVVTPATASAIPSAATDKIRIGVTRTFTNQPTTSTAVTCDSLTVGTANVVALLNNPLLTIPSAITLTINNTFTVNSISMYHGSIGTANTRTTFTLVGTGSVTCNGNVQIGNNTSPPTGLIIGIGALNGTVYSRLSAQMPTFNIGGNVYLNSTGNNADGVNFPEFMLDNGNVTIGGRIITQNTNTFSGTQASPTVAIRGLFQLDNSATNTTSLTLTNNAAINEPIAAGQVIDFTNNGTSSCTVIYASTTGSQTVYSGVTARIGRANFTYDNLTLTGPSTKVVQGNYTTGTPGLTVGGNLLTQGGAVNMLTNGSQIQVAGNWTNSAATTQGAGDIDINGFLSTSGTLTLGAGNLYVAGNYTNSGTFTYGTGTVIYDGTAQTLLDNGNGTTYRNVNFTGGGTKTMSAGNFAVAPVGILTMSSSSVLNVTGNFTLQSSTTSTASVDAIPTGSSITGNVNVQRMLVGGNGKAANGAYTARGYRMLSSPVQIGTSRLYALNYIGLTALTGGPGTGFTVNNSNPTIYLYREDVTPSNTTFNSGKHKGILNINGNLVDVSGGPTGISVPIGNGYIFYFVGNTTNPATKASANPTTGPENTIITATGNLNQQNVLVSLWYTPAGATGGTTGKLSFNSALGTSAGYNMVGNPYAATLDLNSVISTNSSATGIQNSIYVLDNVNPGQQYVVYSPAGGSSPRANRYLASGQGFIVKAKAANSTLTFQEANKAVASQPSPLLMGIPLATQNGPTGLYVKMERDSLIADYCGVYFSGSSSANFNDEDAKDLDGTSSQIYMSSYTADGVRTAVNHMPDYVNGSRVRLYINTSADGIHKLRVEDVRNIDTLYNIWLKDKYKKDSLDIRRYGTYNFNVVRSDTATYGGNRFELVIRRKPLPPYQLIDFAAAKTTEGIKLNWKTYNEGNFTGFTVEKLQPSTGQYVPLYNQQSNSKTNYAYTDLTPQKGVNTYRLQQNDIDGKITWSKPVSISVADDPTPTIKTNLISVYPNPAAAMINVSVNPQTPANGYTAKIYNYTGAVVSRQKVNGNNWTQDVTQLQPGTYIIELNKADGELVGRSKFIKR
ncbi:T9SS type A sorting domain-containing protein [Mucilaginibacter pallidiroseus]|uniref:T9SS type A sorting domain-containing protein n=1 Tax=Mucilaginibacter pallidiroseus TaxID=2599295 RepID=A0A563UCN8_9SPHI|nr:T9SS type A sorting domain-containing protein [Mucilaginibacter pallidiroseus]TWR29029.1 T9SS type A sorting domain-containing protein [Mucilaginibacter pallidiroseus]